MVPARGLARDGFVQLRDSTGAEIWTDNLAVANTQVIAQRAARGPDGAFLVVGVRQDPMETRSFARRYTADGAVETVAEQLFFATPAALEFGPMGDAWMLDQSGVLVRFTQWGAANIEFVPDEDLLGFGLGLRPDGTRSLGLLVARGPDLRPVPRIQTTDPFNATSCRAAGRCVDTAPDACADGNACTTGTCLPATGACVAADLADGSPCGVGRVCGAGGCR